ncbi:MICAL-like protein 1 isoform X1 [Polypterus senegalus]|nr:MICAL-like protein 1 isoform X1 [Polypterus senegalus]
MGSLKALQDWCRIQCENYPDVEIKNMTSSFRDGMAFCAIIHKHRPDLIDINSLSKENVYENNKLAFEVAESELGIPALLDPEDMVAMRVPDRLSIITYVSQYYNYFSNKAYAGPTSMKRPGSTTHNEPALKKPTSASSERRDETRTSVISDNETPKRETLSSTCTTCKKHVHLVQRYLVDGKLYHRNCFRCKECSSTLLPGSYKAGSELGTFLCTHHFLKTGINQNGRPDLSNSLGLTRDASPSAAGEMVPETPPSGRETSQPFSARRLAERFSVPRDGAQLDRVKTEIHVPGTAEEEKQESAKTEVSSNPFEDEEGEEKEKPQLGIANGETFLPEKTDVSETRPVPAPRKVLEPNMPSPTARPVPRPRQSGVTGVETSSRGGRPQEMNGALVDPSRDIPLPRERSLSPLRNKIGIEGHCKDPPWMALVQSEKKKPAPPPPPPAGGKAACPPTGPASKENVQVPEVSSHSLNPFEDEEADDDSEKGGEEDLGKAKPVPAGGSLKPSHPWYGITPTSSPKIKKRLAPQVPPTPFSAQSHSEPPSSTPSPARSIENVSSEMLAKSPLDGSGSPSAPESPVTKSISEPTISGPDIQHSAKVISEAGAHQVTGNKSPAQANVTVPSMNTSSAPATPQATRSTSMRAARPPPPRPPTTPSPISVLFPVDNTASSKSSTLSSQAPKLVHQKSSCKENPFNRKSSPVVSPQRNTPKGPKPARPPAPGHGFPLIKRKVQSDQYIPVEDIHFEMDQIEHQLDELEHRGVELEQKLRCCDNEEEEESLLVDWFKLIHEKHLLVRRESELVYTAKQQNLEERQADVEYELRCLLNKPEKDWTDDDRTREQELMQELVTIIEQRNAIVNCLDEDRQREEEEDKMLEDLIKKKDFHKDSDSDPKKKGKFKPMKVLKLLSSGNKTESKMKPQREKSKSMKSLSPE